jgi:neutral ceramidase
MTLRAGAARVAITPPVGVELAGYGFGPSVGILDDLEAQALVLESEGTSAAIVTADLLTAGPEFVANVRARVEATLGIPGSHVLVSASHSHSSPTAMPLRQWGRVDPAYVRALESRLVGAIAMAQRRAQEARLGLGLGHVDTISENRRATAGTIDPAVPVLRLDDAAGAPIAVLYNFACHPVSLHSYRNLISPDYPGYARSVIRQVLGPETVVMFTLGAAGDINPAGYVAGATTPRRSRQIGAILGCEVARAALDPAYEDDPPLRVVQTLVDLPVEPLPPVAELEPVRDQWAAEAERMQAAGLPWAQVSETQIVRDWAADAIEAQRGGQVQRTVPCEVQAIRLGSAALLALPLEVFAETGLAIVDASPAAVTLISTNSNGGVGYLATKDAYGRRDYTNPQGLAPKVYGLYALSAKAEPLLRRTAPDVLQTLWHSG